MGRLMDMFGRSSALTADRLAAVAEKQYAANAARWQERDQQIRMFLSNLPGMAYRCKNDPNWTMEFVSKGVLLKMRFHYATLPR